MSKLYARDTLKFPDRSNVHLIVSRVEARGVMVGSMGRQTGGSLARHKGKSQLKPACIDDNNVFIVSYVTNVGANMPEQKMRGFSRAHALMLHCRLCEFCAEQSGASPVL